MHTNESMSEVKEYLIQKVKDDAILCSFKYDRTDELQRCTKITNLLSHFFSICATFLSMWDLTGIKPMAPALEGGVLTTRLLTKSLLSHFL